MPGNLLTCNGRLTGEIDFDAAGLGDPSQDLIVAWMLLPAQVRPAFRVMADNARYTIREVLADYQRTGE